MTDATVTCPNCGTSIKLTEGRAAPLLAATKKELDAKLAARSAEVAAREQEKLAKAQKAQLAAIRKQRDLYDKKWLLEVTAEKRT